MKWFQAATLVNLLVGSSLVGADDKVSKSDCVTPEAGESLLLQVRAGQHVQPARDQAVDGEAPVDEGDPAVDGEAPFNEDDLFGGPPVDEDPQGGSSLLLLHGTTEASHPQITDKGASGCSASSPCGVCEGDCDRDHDCQGDLRCFQRDGLFPVPGCAGGSTLDHDYCYHATGPPLRSTGNCATPDPAEFNKNHSCGLCEGSCTSHDQCEGDLLCFRRGTGPIGETDVPPGCTGGGAGDIAGHGYCFAPEPSLVNSGPSGCNPAWPCEACQGDCDRDEDCADGLKCFQRNGLTKVPGCAGGGSGDAFDHDYCVRVCPDYSGIYTGETMYNGNPLVLSVQATNIEGPADNSFTTCVYSNEFSVPSWGYTFPNTRRSWVYMGTDGKADFSWMERHGFSRIVGHDPVRLENSKGDSFTREE